MNPSPQNVSRGDGIREINRVEYGSQLYPDLQKITSCTQVQYDSIYLTIPLEIRDAIFEMLWQSAGRFQHIILRHGSYIHVPCISDHFTEDTYLMDQCAEYGGRAINNAVLWQRLRSEWGNHWRCEESFHSRNRQRPTRSVFLACLLSCRQL